MPSSSRSPSPTSSRPGGAVPPLPVELTTFVGRDHEVAEVERLLASSRLLTLTGAGGSGKSRLALEVVGRVAHRSDASVAWVELAALTDPRLIPRHIAEACGIAEGVGEGGAGALAEVIRARPLLLVLDNCEHLVEACAQLVDSLLRACPELRVLATSREALGVRGERAWLVPALSLPEEGAAGRSALDSSEAVRLFVERARDVNAGFELTDENAGAIAEICRRLDGIPLAIELAAARVKVLTPDEIRARMDDAFPLLTSGSRTTIARHRTLRATMDWSHDLLTEDARVLLRRLAVFRGGFSLDTVEAVGSGEGIERAHVLDLVTLLVDRSLVTMREQGGTARYILLETVRQYAASKLTESGEEPEIRRRHARLVAELVAEAEPHLIRPERKVWMDRLLPELDNIREALYCSRHHDRTLHVSLVGMLWWFWYSTRHWREAGTWISGALELPEAGKPGPERAALLFAGGALAALQARGGEARPLLEEAARLAQEFGRPRLEAYALNYLGMAYAGDGDPRGKEYSERAALWFQANADLYGLRLAHLLLGTLACAAKDFASAERLNQAGLEIARQFRQDREVTMSLQNLAAVYLNQGDVARAVPPLTEALTISQRDPSYFFLFIGLTFSAEALGHLGRTLEAARIFGAAEALGEMIGARRFKLDAVRLEAAIPGFRHAAGAEAFDRAWAEGRALTPESATREILEAFPSGVGATSARNTSRTEATPGRVGSADSRDGRGALSSGEVDLRVCALGSFDVAVNGERVRSDAWTYAKPKELLVYLLSHANGRTRDAIGEALWPGAAAAQVKNSFHVTLHHLRKTLSHPEWIVRQGDSYLVSPDIRKEFDVLVFEGEVRAALATREGPDSEARLARALALYRGDLLEGQPVGRWHQDERDRLRSLYVQGSLALGELLERRGAVAESAELYHKIVRQEELNEEAHRRLMLAWARSGERTRALRHYEHLVGLLKAVLDAEPEPESTEVLQRIRASAV